MKRTALITGITGQDGSVLAEYLLTKDYKVIGLKRRASSNSLGCAKNLVNDIEVVESDLNDLSSLQRVVKTTKPDEVYSLAAQSHVGTSFEQPIYTAQVTGLGVLNLLEAVRSNNIYSRLYQASSSEMFGGTEFSDGKLLDENSTFHPRSPYGVAKLFAHWSVINYRESYKLHASNGILFNHEEPGKRGPNFVTRKITLGIRDIKFGKQDKLYIGNLDAQRDWGMASDFVEGMWLMLQQPYPSDYVLATGETHSVREFCQLAFEHAGLGDYNKYVVVDPKFYRPAEVNILCGDYTKAKEILGWQPKHTFQQLVYAMVDEDLKHDL